VSFSSDYYSLGILAYELLVGAPPHGYCKNGSTLEEKIDFLNPIIKGGISEDYY
jgi:serine/threonine protein kinase